MKNQSGSLAWFIWGLGALFYCYEFLLQVSPGVMVPELMHDFNVNASFLGLLGSFYFWAYASMQIPAGIFLDQFGPRKLLTITCALCAIGTLVFVGAHSFSVACIGRVLIGIGSAFAVLGTFKLGANWFPPNRFALICGLTLMIGMIGAIGAGTPLAFLISYFHWRPTLFGLAIFGFILSIVLWLWVRDTPNNQVTVSKSEPHASLNLLTGLFYILQKKQNWIIAIYGGLMFCPTSAFAAFWGVPFLMVKYNIDRPLAAGAISMFFLGWVFGGPLFGWISDTIKRRLPTLYIGAIGVLITMTLIIYVQMPISLLYIVLFGGGFFTAAFLPSFSIIREINSPNTTATGLGFMNALNMVGGAFLQPLIGWLLDLQWNGVIENNIRVYNVTNYSYALALFPIIIFIALCLVPFIRETYCQSEQV